MLSDVVLLVDEQYLAAASQMIHTARRELLISSFKMGQPAGNKYIKLAALYKAVEQASSRGVDVKVLLNHILGSNTVARINRVTAEALKKKSVHLRTLASSRTIHAKLIIADQEQMILGSHNWTNRSLSSNFETSLLIKHPPLARETSEIFMGLWNDARVF